MLRICQLPLKGGAQYSLPPGGEGVTAGDGRGDLQRSSLITNYAFRIVYPAKLQFCNLIQQCAQMNIGIFYQNHKANYLRLMI